MKALARALANPGKRLRPGVEATAESRILAERSSLPACARDQSEGSEPPTPPTHGLHVAPASTPAGDWMRTTWQIGVRGVHCESVTRVILPQNSWQAGGYLHGQASASADELDDAGEKAGPLAAYHRKVEAGTLKPGDEHQVATLEVLQRLYDDLMISLSSRQVSGRDGGFWSHFLPRPHSSSSRGLYLYGGVGTGKTMLMDMFYNELPDGISKRRVHFHDFMLDIHGQLKQYKGTPDPLEAVAIAVIKESSLLCLDEFMVTDVADAMILNRLFKQLFAKGLVLISTSNRPPDSLYEGGLQRPLFMPFIDLLKTRCIVHGIGSTTDYRRLSEMQHGLYFIGEDGDRLLQSKFRMCTDGGLASPTSVEVVMGRKLQVPFAVNGGAYYQFHELCELPLGAADYSALCKNFHTVAVEGVPAFGASNRTAAYRFVTLIDVIYEHRTRFICSAETDPIKLLERVVTRADAPRRTSSRSNRSDPADICVDDELGFAKARTISRITEMQTPAYEAAHREHWPSRQAKPPLSHPH